MFRIGELAHLGGVRVRRVRYYNDLGPLYLRVSGREDEQLSELQVPVRWA